MESKFLKNLRLLIFFRSQKTESPKLRNLKSLPKIIELKFTTLTENCIKNSLNIIFKSS
jgi:hypothetical protein